MSKLDNAQSGSHVTDTPEDAPVLLYDAGCSMCNELAYKVRERANGPLRLVALSDPEADELLSQHYSGSWSKDFYFVNGGTARKGKRALPSVMKTVGVKDFTTLVGDYLQHVRNESGSCDHEEASAGSRLSRRSFVGTAAAAGTALFAGTAAGRTFQSRPPRGLDISVARVSPDGAGGFDVSIEQDNSLIRTKQWEPDDDVETQGESPVSMDTVDTQTITDSGTLQIQRQETEITVTDDSKRLDEAFKKSGSSSSDTGKMTRFGVVDDRERYGFSLNFAEAPLKRGDSEIVGTTTSGQISHDIARKTVDFVKFESDGPENMKSHLRGYAAALRAYAGHYQSRGDVKMSRLYQEMAGNMEENVQAIAESYDGELEPVQNVLAISSVPNWTDYVESPSTDDSERHQSDNVVGADCGCSCCVGCCTGCDCGCSVCIGTPKPGCGCACCIGGCGSGCGCGCCYCL